MSGWLWGRAPQPTAEELAAAQAEKNARTMQVLQEKYDDKMTVATNLGNNVRRLAQEGARYPAGSPQRADADNQKKSAFATMQEMKRQADLLWSQIQALRRVTSNVENMGTNLELHNRYKESNQVSKTVSGTVDVDAVTDTMDEAHEHLTAHDEMSEALAGRTMGAVVDPDEQDAALSSFLDGYTEPEVAVMAATAREQQDNAYGLPQAYTGLNPRQLQEQREAQELSAYEDSVLKTLGSLSSPPAAVSRSGK
jgi:hypothetical protein